jgi:uncharacterized radical SAM superfamily Fe-S cluster-containing enzyme
VVDVVKPAPKKRSLLALAPESPATTSTRSLAAATARLRELGSDESQARAFFGALGGERALKTTATLCPMCLAYAPGLVVVDERGRVSMRKVCAEHGASRALLENDASFYRLSTRDSSGHIFANDIVDDHGVAPVFAALDGVEGAACCADGECGTGQSANATCTLLVEITNACNLACKVCYADSKGDRILPFDDVKRYLTRILDEKGKLDSVQVTGGEASLHPDFWSIVGWLHDEPRITKIYLPTNGLLFAKPDHAAMLEKFRAKLIVLLQFDSNARDANMSLRAADTRKIRDGVVDDLGRRGIFMQLTMTLARGVNEDEAGEIVKLGLRHDHVKVIALQPATTSGRYDVEIDPENRATMSDVIKAVRNKRDDADFVPIPCSHPNCGWITLFFRRFGIVENIVAHVDLEQQRAKLTNKALLSTNELRDVVGSEDVPGLIERIKVAIGKRIVRSQDIFTVAVKPFMDKHTYDQDRIATCCHHLMDTRGNVTSFCEYNALLRPQDSWDRLPKIVS